MKNKKLKWAVVILIVVLLFPSCTGKAGAQTGGGKSINSATELKEYLDKQPANSPDKPIKVAMKANEMMIKDIAKVISEAGKYVSLDLSGSPLTKIPDNAFEDCKTLAGIIIPNSVTSIGDRAFIYCENLTNVTIPNSVTSIGENAFRQCTSLTSVTIPNSVTSIGSYAFYGCTSLASVTIGNGVTSIGEGPFRNCTSLTAINVDAANSAYTSQDGVLYNKAKTTLVQYPAGKTGAFSIPTSVTDIGTAFFGCTSLTSVTIPSGVTRIVGNAFYGCTSLTSVTIPNSVTRIEAAAFVSCTSLTSVTIPNSVTRISLSAFADCTSLTSVTFQGTISAANLETTGSFSTFDGDLRAKYLAGGIGTYTTTAPVDRNAKWTKQ